MGGRRRGGGGVEGCVNAVGGVLRRRRCTSARCDGDVKVH